MYSNDKGKQMMTDFKSEFSAFRRQSGLKAGQKSTSDNTSSGYSSPENGNPQMRGSYHEHKKEPYNV